MTRNIPFPFALALAAALTACSTEGNVFTSTERDASVSLDAAANPDAVPSDTGTSPDVSTPIDSGADSGVTDDAEPRPPAEWTNIPGLYGGTFRHVGGSEDRAHFFGRNFADSQFSLYRLDESGAVQKLGLTVDAMNRPLPLPIGSLAEVGTRIMWATDSDGIIVSEDGGATFKSLNIPWQDGSVGMGNGHVSRIVAAWRAGNRFCVHREVTPWVNFQVRDDERYNEVRCVDAVDQWTVETSSIAEGMRFFVPHGEELVGVTAPLYNLETGDPKFCRSPDLGANWTCFSTALDEGFLSVLDSGRVVARNFVDAPPPAIGTYTELWYSDDFGANWTLALTVPDVLSEVTVSGDLIYAVPYDGREARAIYEIDLAIPSYSTHVRPTEAHVDWMDLFVHRGTFHFTTTRGVHRFDEVNNSIFDLPMEAMPAIDVTADSSGDVWAIDATNTARRFGAGDSTFSELYFDDSGWATGDSVDHARVIRFVRSGDQMIFGAGHRKVYTLDTSMSSTVAVEDQTLIGILHPDASLWRIAAHGDNLFVAPTAGEDQNHGTGERFAWGGGVYRKNLITGQWANISRGLPVRPIDSTLGDAYVASLYAGEGLVVAATHAGIYSTADLGARWTQISGPPAYDATMEQTSIAGLGTTVMIARSTGGGTTLYFSTDGQNFAAVSNNLVRGQVRDLAAYGDAFFALLDTAGVHESRDRGATWTPAGTGAFPARAYSLYVDDVQILAGTRDGVWKLDLTAE